MDITKFQFGSYILVITKTSSLRSLHNLFMYKLSFEKDFWEY